MAKNGNWSILPLSDLGNGIRPVLKAGPFGSSLTKSMFVDKGYRVYGQQEVLAGDPWAGSYYVPESKFLELQSCAVLPGDILISMMGTVGRALVIPNHADAGIINPRLMRISIDQKRVDPEYLCAVLQSPRVHVMLERRAHGGTMPGLNTAALSSMLVPVPSLAEQKEIVAILRTWDEAIGITERLIAAKTKQLSWFRSNLLSGEVRVPGRWSGWATVRLADVLVEHGQVSTGAEEVFSVSVHKGLINQVEHLGRSFASASTAHYNRVLPGDIVYTKSPTGDFPLGIIKQSKVNEPVIVSPLYGVFTPETPELGFILDAYFQAPETTRNYLAPLVQKGAKNTIAITNQRFLEGKLHLPRDPGEQRAIVEVLREAFSEIDTLRAYTDALRRQKRGLMQKLLTGEWRTVPDGVSS